MSINELHQELQANPRWIAEYEAHGRRINVSIPIIVPNVEKIPIIEAVMDDPITMDEQVMNCKHGELNIIGTDGTYFRKAEDKELYTVLNPDSEKAEISYVKAGDITCDMPDKIIYVEYNPAYQLLATNNGRDYLKYESFSYYPYEIDFEKTYAEDNSTSLSQAVQCVQDILNYYFDNQKDGIEINYVEICGRARKTKGMDNYNLGEYVDYYPAGTYKISFCQKLSGIPIYMTAHKMYSYSDSKITRWLDFSETGRLECQAEIMSRETSYYVYARLMKEKQVIQEDVPLADVQTIIKSIEQEIERGHIRNVYALRLGYTCFLNDDSLDSFTLYPMWFLECDYVSSAKEELKTNDWSDKFRDGYNFTTLALNAQTGEMMGRELQTEEQLMCPQIITY